MRLKSVGFLFAGLLVLALAGGALYVRLGVYNIAATKQHTAPVYWLLREAKKWSVRQRAEEISAPDLSGAETADRGMRLYQRHCVQCHGAPGVPRGELGRGMAPVPTALVQTAREWTPSEIFWVIKYGIKMTGMPSWDYRMPDRQIWDLVAFMKTMPGIAPADYRAAVAGLETDAAPAATTEDGAGVAVEEGRDSVERGKRAIEQYACIACHTVPGIVGPDTRVGPPLHGMGARKYIAGVLPNTTENMVRWLRDPPAVAPLTAMPDLDVKPAHARDMAAYLSTLTE